MDSNKTASSGSSSNMSMKKLSRRFEELKSEFFRIQWTEEGEVSTYTKAVIVATFVSGMVLYIADLVVHRSLLGIDTILRFIFG
jgi:preprotein translocase SecE subunit